MREKGEAREAGPCRYRVQRPVQGNPEVSILMPTAGNLERLQAALKSVIDETTYCRFEIVVVDNSSGDQVADLIENLRYSRRPVRHADFREHPFNFSQLCNSAARLSEAPFYLFLNDDVTVVTAEWLTALVEHAQRDEVGAVGARLLYPNGRIQHAGVVMGVYENAGHHFKGVKSDQSYYFDLPGLVRNCAAVTGACMLLRRERFWEVTATRAFLGGGWIRSLPRRRPLSKAPSGWIRRAKSPHSLPRRRPLSKAPSAGLSKRLHPVRNPLSPRSSQ